MTDWKSRRYAIYFDHQTCKRLLIHDRKKSLAAALHSARRALTYWAASAAIVIDTKTNKVWKVHTPTPNERTDR